MTWLEKNDLQNQDPMEQLEKLSNDLQKIWKSFNYSDLKWSYPDIKNRLSDYKKSLEKNSSWNKEMLNILKRIDLIVLTMTNELTEINTRLEKKDWKKILADLILNAWDKLHYKIWESLSKNEISLDDIKSVYWKKFKSRFWENWSKEIEDKIYKPSINQYKEWNKNIT